MTPYKDLIKMLEEAQDIMSESYHWACVNGVSSVERSLSVADSCVIEAIDHLTMLAAAEIHAGDGGYREVSLKTPEFLEIQARHHALYGENK